MPVSYADAQSIILKHVNPLACEHVHLFECAGRILAEDMVAPWSMPLWSNSAMDGYAVHADDCQCGARLQVCA